MSNLDSGGSVPSTPFGLVYNQSYPNGLIPAGSVDTNISDFRLSSGNFIPIYFTNTLPVQYAMTFDSTGAMTITGTGVQDILGFGDRQVMIGMKSRSRIFPDSAGILKYEIQLTFMNANDVPANALFDHTFGLMEGNAGPESPFDFSNFIVGAGMSGIQSQSKILLKTSQLSGGIPSGSYKVGTQQTIWPWDAGIIKPVLIGSIWMRITRQYNTASNPWNLLRCNDLVEYSFDHAIWNNFNQGTGGDQNIQGWNIFRGSTWMVGFFSRYLAVCNYTINNFSLLQGFMSYLP